MGGLLRDHLQGDTLLDKALESQPHHYELFLFIAPASVTERPVRDDS